MQPEPPTSEPLGVVSIAAPDVPPPAVAALPTPPTSSASPRDFGDAQREFEIAYQASKHGNYDAALAALAAHERNFPAGAFAAERTRLRARIAALRPAGEPQK
jgi:TolA-binding protein